MATVSSERAHWLKVLVRWPVYMCLMIAKFGFGFLCANVAAEGTRLLFPAWGKKLHRMPGFGILRDYEATYQLDGAFVFAGFVIFIVFAVWDAFFTRVLKAEASGDRYFEYADLFPTVGDKFAIVAGIVLSATDFILMYRSMNEMSWGSGWFSLTSLLAACAYFALIVLFCFVVAHFRHNINKP